jgi:hypothetical protein
MAKGSLAKEEITQKILKEFEGSFVNEKEIRIPWVENGETLQIKVALTCAKVNVEPSNGTVVAGSDLTSAPAADGIPTLTKEEKEKVNDLITRLGL